MRLGINQTGHAPDALRRDCGDYDLFFPRLLGEGTFYCVTYPVVDDIVLEGAKSADGWGGPWLTTASAIGR